MNTRPFSSFGDLLKSFRKRRHLTQKSLAARIGVHTNTISIWECGNYLPESKTLVLEAASQLGLNERETRQFLEASLTALSPYWLLPFSRNPFFTGRDGILEEVESLLHASPAVALTQSFAFHGLGGIGKTQLAVEYAYRHALEYTAIFWIAAETVESIIASFLAIAEVLSLSEREEAVQQRIVTAVQHWLSTHKGWLLIWDNLEDLELLQRFLPSTRHGATIITTRCQAVGTLAQGIQLQTMPLEEGMRLLLCRAKVLAPPAM
ncbi:MAG TPA: NB-ARC domain-containing protein, partial [Ktedonobacteraceae bacterium]|nr:NB-ARC domain-containing protein [Ktedonobacteraceae bacterium]